MCCFFSFSVVHLLRRVVFISFKWRWIGPIRGEPVFRLLCRLVHNGFVCSLAFGTEHIKRVCFLTLKRTTQPPPLSPWPSLPPTKYLLQKQILNTDIDRSKLLHCFRVQTFLRLLMPFCFLLPYSFISESFGSGHFLRLKPIYRYN